MEELSIEYFRELLDKHIKELKGFCEEWKDVASDKTIAEEVVDEVRTTVGLTNLLLGQKIKQFGGLIDDSEFKRGEKEITCIDLQGFWDMVFNEVEKIRKSFKKLEKCRSNNWVFIEEPVPKIEAKKKPTVALTTKVTTAAKAHAVAARQRLAEAKQKMMAAKRQAMREAKNNASEEIVIMEPNLKENGTMESTYIVKKKIVDPKEQPEPIKETVKDVQKDIKEDSSKTSKKRNPVKSGKKTELPQETNGRRKKHKSEKISIKEKENSTGVENKKELLTVTSEKVSTKRSKSPKEVVPSRYETRSVRRAMLAQQND